MEPLRYVFQKLEKNEKKMFGKFCIKYSYTVTELTRTFGKALLQKKKKRIFAKLQFHYRKNVIIVAWQ